MASGNNPFLAGLPPLKGDHSHTRVALVTTTWHAAILDKLVAGAREVLRTAGVTHLALYTVPGAFELPQLAAQLARQTEPDAIICLGCIIKGETKHDEYIAHAVATGLTRVSVEHYLPVTFGVLTVNTEAQAEARAGGEHGNKGAEAAYTALRMLELRRDLKPNWVKP